MKSTLVPCFFLGILLRWGLTHFPYSGEGKPPMYGDFEAQRHWMEITINLPIREWYINSTKNDLNYWGLDYPPLSAYHSFGIGHFLKNVLPESVQFGTSKGFESPLLKCLLRFTVLASDLLLPALLAFHYSISNDDGGSKKSLGIFLIPLSVIAPPLLIVDYGHFQYNCVSLGLTVFAVIFLFKERVTLSSICYSLAVNHKQMSLYHAVPFFSQMLALVVFKKRNIPLTLKVGFSIAATLACLWLPFGLPGIKHVLERIFPLKRGVFEDKVGTFWYVLDRFIPIKGAIPDAVLARVCALICLLLVLPSAIHLFKTTICKDSSMRNKAFLQSLFNVSMIFFLFSYHVHEKSIMLPCLAAVLLLNTYPFEMIWFIIVSSFSLYPLMYEEKSHIALLISIGIFTLMALQSDAFELHKSIYSWRTLLLASSFAGYGSLIVALHFLTPPARLPHLFQAGFALLSFIHYVGFLIYGHFLQLCSKFQCKVQF